MSKLFRDEAIKHHARRLDGAVILASPLSVRLLGAFLVIIVFGSLAFAGLATYARKETVAGWITTDRGLLRAVASGGGRVESIAVEEGQVVPSGAEIAVLRLSSDISEGDAGEVLVAGLVSEEDAQRSAGEASAARLALQAAQLNENKANLQAERREIARQVSLQEERVRIAQADVARLQVLADRGYFPLAQLDARKAGVLAAEQDLAALRQRRLSLDRDLIDVSARIDSIPLETTAAQASADTVIAQLQQRRADAQSRSQYVVRTPVSGRIAALPVRVGQTVAAGATVAAVVPEGSHLEAELYVPSRAAGFIREGQEVRLLYQAFPHQRFGAGYGEVISVSRTVLAPSEVAIPGVVVAEPVFRVRVRIARDYVEAYRQRLPLQAGMLLTADVIVDRRSLIEWLLDPLYAAGRR